MDTIWLDFTVSYKIDPAEITIQRFVGHGAELKNLTKREKQELGSDLIAQMLQCGTLVCGMSSVIDESYDDRIELTGAELDS